MKRSVPRSRPQTRSRQIDVGTRAIVALRDEERCIRCREPSRQIHHRRPRGMGGTTDPAINDPRNLVTLCGSGTTGCHGWVESQRDRARQLGWLIDSLSDEQLDRPIRLGEHLWVYLDAHGHATTVRIEIGSKTPPHEEDA